MKPFTIMPQNFIREEELKNRVAAMFFGKYDCTRIVGNIDFCVLPKRRDPRQMMFIPDTPILWAEAKNHPTDVYRMLAQLILTIKGEQKCGVEPPRFVGCFDNEKIAFVEYHYILPVFNLNDFNWTQTPSAVDEKTVETVRGVISQDKVVVFRFGADNAEIKAFIARNFAAGDAPVLATPIDRNNFTFIYQKWRNEVMSHIDAPWDVLKKKYALYDRDFFLAEMNVDDNGTPEVSDDRPAEDFYITFDATAREPYTIRRKNEDELNFNLTFGFKPGGLDAYAAFWRRYKRPPKREYWDFIVSRLDLLVPQDVRERKGSFFTPAIWVEKSQQYLAAVLGENWQDEHYVWDCAGGTGNLEVGLTNKYRVWVSTLDQQDVDVIHERINNGANLLDSHVFRFDFLNDSFDKLPEDLRDVINDPEKRKRLVIYINPPYAEAGDIRQRSGTGENKTDVSVSHAAYDRYVGKIGLAGRELFAQFLMRIHDEIPGCVIGQFSKLKHLQGPNFKQFREEFHGTLEKCFIVPADTFDNVKGQFPIGFFVWRLGDDFNAEAQSGREGTRNRSNHKETGAKLQAPLSTSHADLVKGNHLKSPRLCDSALNIFTSTVADVYDRKGEFIGQKTLLSYDNERSINNWLIETRKRPSTLQLGFLSTRAHDVQDINTIYIKRDKALIKSARGSWITDANIVEASIYVAVCHSIEDDWLNDRDQFLFPRNGWNDDVEFRGDCVIFTLFANANYIRSCDGVNHWIPFTEEEVGAKACFKSHFMSDFINGKVTHSRVADSRRVEDNAPYQSELELSTTPPNPVNPVEKHSAPHPCQGIRCADSLRLRDMRLCVRENISTAARAVLDAGRELWKYYHAQTDANPNASYYDIRAHFQGCKPNGAMNTKSSDATYNAIISALRTAHKELAAQIEPKVYEYGFLKR